jgi:hypothetical protein
MPGAVARTSAFALNNATLPFALKLTASGVTQPDFADFLDRALRTWKTPLKRLTIEVHESALPIATEELKTTLARLKKLGVRLCIDGLGTASVSLSSLAQLPLDEVKIGATFVGNNEQQIFHVKVVRLLANLAKSLDLTVTAFDFDAQEGTLKPVQSLSTIPAAITDRSGFSTAEIAVHPSGKFVYGSNRGHDSIAMYAVDGPTGRLTFLGVEPIHGKTPRNFAIDPSGKWLLAAGQDSHGVSVFAIDQGSGKLAFTGRTTPVPAPVCISFR